MRLYRSSICLTVLLGDKMKNGYVDKYNYYDYDTNDNNDNYLFSESLLSFTQWAN